MLKYRLPRATSKIHSSSMLDGPDSSWKVKVKASARRERRRRVCAGSAVFKYMYCVQDARGIRKITSKLPASAASINHDIHAPDNDQATGQYCKLTGFVGNIISSAWLSPWLLRQFVSDLDHSPPQPHVLYIMHGVIVSENRLSP